MSPDWRTPRPDETAEELARRLSVVYSEEHMQTIRGAEHIRLNPGMYIGNVQTAGIHCMLFGVVGSPLPNDINPHGRVIELTLHPDNSVTIADNRNRLRFGPSTDLVNVINETFGDFASRWDDEVFSYGVANALSEWFEVAVSHEGRVYRQEYERGEPVGTLQELGSTTRTGLNISFRPDPTLFVNTHFDPETIRDRLREYAFLNSGLRLTFTDSQTGIEEAFEFGDGIAAFVRCLNEGQKPLHPNVFVFRSETDAVRYEVGLQWREGSETIERLYVNDQFLPHGGTATAGVRTAITRTVNQFIRKHLPGEWKVKGEHIRAGLTAVVSVRMADPQFMGALRTHLGNPEAEAILAKAVGEFLRTEFSANPAAAERIARAAIAESLAEAEWKKAHKRKT